MELSRHPNKSTEGLRALDNWYEGERAAIMADEGLIPAAKKRHLEEITREYKERWILAKAAADKDLEEWSEVFRSRAETAAAPKMPDDKDARILKALELQSLHNRIERARSAENPGPLLAEYERAVRASNHVVAHELEDALPELLSGNERARFGRRATENRLARLSESDRKKVEEHRAFERERSAVERGIDLQDGARKRGYMPGLPTRTTLATSHPPGRQGPQVEEVPNPLWRDPSRQRPTNEPKGGTIMLNHPAEQRSVPAGEKG